MGWETRKGGGRYYTRSRRVNGRIRREYIGTGELAEAMAVLDALEREDRELKREEEQRERKRLDDLDREARTYCAAVDRILADALMAAGYHRHARGEWRKKRHGSEENEGAGDPA